MRDELRHRTGKTGAGLAGKGRRAMGGPKIRDEAAIVALGLPSEMAVSTMPLTGPPVTLCLRVLATSDLHAHILPWDYHADRPSDTRGLSRVAGLIEIARAKAGNVLLLDNGDFLHGSPLGDFVVQAVPRPDHPMITAMNRLGYDAATLGNHEFSHGIDLLCQSLGAAQFPVVSANLRHHGEERFFLPPYAILDRKMADTSGTPHPLRIGVIGFLPPQTVIWERAHLQGRLEAQDIVNTAKALVPELRAQGVDLVIALSHSGIGTGDDSGGDENASLALAAVEGIDAVIAGHTHEVFPITSGAAALHGRPAVMPGFFGSHLGVIDLTLEKSGAAGWQVVAHRAEARPIAGRDAVSGQAVALVGGQPEIEDLAAPLHAALKAQGDRVVGQTLFPLHSYLALVTESSALRLVAEAQADHLRLSLQGTTLGDLPLVSAVAPFKAGGRGGPENYTDIPAGSVTERHVADLYLHPNRLVALRVTGQDLADWLERSVSLFHQIAPGARDADLVDPDFPSFNFDMIYGLGYQIDLSQPARFEAKGRLVNPAARRIVGLCHQGKPVDPQASFLLATNSYRISGGAGFPACTSGPPVYSSARSISEILRGYVARKGSIRINPMAPPQWKLAALHGTSAILRAAPAAARHLAEVAALHPEPLDLQADGYQRFRLHL
jgi:2',3'-cyclic-nucleotide 2'-phosphodiesterase/3'-nucleotidase